MDIKRKLELVKSSIVSISTHEDEDAAVRHAALDQIDSIVKVERDKIDQAVKARIAQHLNTVAES